jgi:hypothetical protein
VPLVEARPAFANGVVTTSDNDHLPTASFLRALTRRGHVPPPVAPKQLLSGMPDSDAGEPIADADRKIGHGC